MSYLKTQNITSFIKYKEKRLIQRKKNRHKKKLAKNALRLLTEDYGRYLKTKYGDTLQVAFHAAYAPYLAETDFKPLLLSKLIHQDEPYNGFIAYGAT